MAEQCFQCQKKTTNMEAPERKTIMPSSSDLFWAVRHKPEIRHQCSIVLHGVHMSSLSFAFSGSACKWTSHFLQPRSSKTVFNIWLITETLSMAQRCGHGSDANFPPQICGTTRVNNDKPNVWQTARSFCMTSDCSSIRPQGLIEPHGTW